MWFLEHFIPGIFHFRLIMEKGEEKTVLFIIKTPILVMSSSAQKSYKLSVYTHNLILDKNWVLTVYKNQNRRGQFMGVTLAC